MTDKNTPDSSNNAQPTPFWGELIRELAQNPDADSAAIIETWQGQQEGASMGSSAKDAGLRGAAVLGSLMADLKATDPDFADPLAPSQNLPQDFPEDFPEDLVLNTLDRCLVILPDDDQSDAGRAAVSGKQQGSSQSSESFPSSAFRSSVEALTRLPLEQVGARPSRRRLFLRFVTQAAAAVLLVVSLSAFWNIYYPAYTLAREKHHLKTCATQLKRLWKAAKRFQAEQPNDSVLPGRELRDTLVKFGYADAKDFQCPGLPDIGLNAIHYSGQLPKANDTRRVPMFWDKFSNHENIINVVFTDGSLATISSEQLGSFLITRKKQQ